jgi:hypothetical protein
LMSRRMRVVVRLSTLPESPMNQVCHYWAATKGASRCFQNANVLASEILPPHAQ